MAATEIDQAHTHTWRIAWLVDGGLVVVDAEQGSGAVRRENTMLLQTGLESGSGSSRMTISRNGDFVILFQQPNFNSPVNVRIFDLRLEDRKKDLAKLDDAGLWQKACLLASLLPGGNKLQQSEVSSTLVDTTAQPCGN
jgi:hypothetical protein